MRWESGKSTPPQLLNLHSGSALEAVQASRLFRLKRPCRLLTAISLLKSHRYTRLLSRPKLSFVRILYNSCKQPTPLSIISGEPLSPKSPFGHLKPFRQTCGPVGLLLRSSIDENRSSPIMQSAKDEFPVDSLADRKMTTRCSISGGHAQEKEPPQSTLPTRTKLCALH